MAGTLYVVSRIIVSKSFTELENRYALKNVERVLDALEYDTDSLNLKAADWAEWDDTYAFVEDLNERYIKENLTDETFQILRANLLIFLDTHKNVRHQQGFDLREEKTVEVNKDDLVAILSIPGLTLHEHEKSHLAGVVLLPQGPMLVASRPILNSQHSGPVKGTLIMGRYLDQAELEQLSKRVHAELSVERSQPRQADQNFNRALLNIVKGEEKTVVPVSETQIAGFAAIRDVQGESPLIARVMMSRDITSHGAWTLTYLFISLLLITTVFGFVTLVVLEKMIIARLLGLESELASISHSGRTDQRVTVDGSDEITNVARRINDALQAVETSADELRVSRDTIQALMNASSDAATLVDRNGRLLAMNEATAQALGADMEDLVGRSPLDFLPEDVANLRRSKFAEAISSGHPVRFEDTNNDRSFQHSFNPVIAADGQVDKVAIFSRDVTDEKRTQQLLIEGTRLKALGEMASGVAHNFNNVLQLMIGTAQAGEMQLERGRVAEALESLKKISGSASLGVETVRRIQDFSRVQSPSGVPGKVFDLTRTVESALDMSVSVWQTNPSKDGIDITLEKSLEPGCFIMGRENEIFEVIINLVKNAVEAMPSGGRIDVKTCSSESRVFFEITDTGVGIELTDLTNVFIPFWSTKGFAGTGMGLASCQGIIHGHNGEMTVKSQKGAWTTFGFTIPRA